MSDQNGNGGRDSVVKTGLTGNLSVEFGTQPDPSGEDVRLPQMPSGFHDGSVFRGNPATGTVEQFGGLTRVNINPHETNPAAGILASARTVSGNRNAPITAKSIVTIPGLPPGLRDMPISVAVQEGFLKPDGRGGWIETSQNAAQYAQAAGTPEQSAAPDVSEGPPLLPETENVVAKIESSVPHGMQAAIEHSMATKGVEATVAQYARHSAMDEGTFRSALQHVQDSMTAQVMVRLEQHGIALEDFAPWAMANHPEDSRRAMLQQIATRRASAYDDLISRFKAAKARGR